MQKFHDVLDKCRLWDLGFVGKKFTWFKNYPSGGIWESLDRAISIVEWLDRFLASKVQSLVYGQSDHSPILILLRASLQSCSGRGVLSNSGLKVTGAKILWYILRKQPTRVLLWLWLWEKLIGAK